MYRVLWTRTSLNILSTVQVYDYVSVICPYTRKETLATGLTASPTVNSKWIIGLNVKHKAIKLRKEHIRENLEELRLGSDFLATAPKA